MKPLTPMSLHTLRFFICWRPLKKGPKYPAALLVKKRIAYMSDHLNYLSVSSETFKLLIRKFDCSTDRTSINWSEKLHWCEF